MNWIWLTDRTQLCETDTHGLFHIKKNHLRWLDIFIDTKSVLQESRKQIVMLVNKPVWLFVSAGMLEAEGNLSDFFPLCPTSWKTYPCKLSKIVVGGGGKGIFLICWNTSLLLYFQQLFCICLFKSLFSQFLAYFYRMPPGPCQPVSGWGGKFKNLGALPFRAPPRQQKFSGKQKFFRKMLAGGGRGSTFCFRKQNVPKNFSNTSFI
jgi:hypothetical protein